MTAGWLLDIYPEPDRMVCWIKQKGGNNVRLEDIWTPSIYVAADGTADLKMVLQNAAAMQFVKDHDFVQRQEKITDLGKTPVLKLTLSDPAKGPVTARRIERLGKFGRFRLYNVDVPPAQSYLYRHDIFSPACCSVRTRGSRLAWELQDDVWSTTYDLDFKKIRLDVRVRKEGGLPKPTDRIDSIIIMEDDKKHVMSSFSEADMLADLESTVALLDPDFISTPDGDTFLFPYLISRAEQNGASLSLSRDDVPLTRPDREGTSYFSYGKIHFKPASVRLHGRVHIDLSNSFIWDEAAMQGLYEVARTCRMPLHTAARASIGRCMSSLQFYHATKKGILIPWKPTLAERFKTYQDLLVADRGGFLFEPEIGVHEKVAEFDFASLYANIMMKKNLSAETVRCECCPDSKSRVPELGYNICEKRLGITPMSLEILIKKRADYKKLKIDNKNDPARRKIFDERQNALKWILVTSFGYLGFNNAKFGRIDAHIAVCAFDRHVFLQASRIAERLGFRVLHGIVDSLWVYKRNAASSDYLELKNTIERETGFEISFEGVYKWIAFVHSKQSGKLPVANRYFGAFEDGSLKIRGIEARRHDTPALFEKFQLEILKIMAAGDTAAEVRALMPQVQATFAKYAGLLKDGKVLFDDLVFVKNVSKDTDQHSERNTVENDALGRLAKEGRMLKAGQTLRYVISGYGKNARKATPLELIDERTAFDSDRYIELLAQTCNSVTEPFGYVVKADDC